MLRTAIPVVAVMLALLTGVGAKAPDQGIPIYPRPGGPPRAAAAMVKGISLSVPRRASTTGDNNAHLQVDPPR
jgi:hypothetical protein